MHLDPFFTCCFLISHRYVWFPLGIGWLVILAILAILSNKFSIHYIDIFPVIITLVPMIGIFVVLAMDDQVTCSEYATQCYQNIGLMLGQYSFGTIQILGIIFIAYLIANGLKVKLQRELEVTHRDPSRYMIQILVSHGLRPSYLGRESLQGILAEKGLLQSLLDQGLDPNIKLVMSHFQLRYTHSVEDGDRLLSSLTLLRRRGAKLNPGLHHYLVNDTSEKLIRTVIEWGCNKPFTPSLTSALIPPPMADDSTYTRLMAVVKPLKWSPSTHQHLTTDKYSATVKILLLAWNTGNGNHINLLPREIFYHIMSVLYDMTVAQN